MLIDVPRHVPAFR